MTTVSIQSAQLSDIQAIQVFADMVYDAQFRDVAQKQRFLERVYSERSLQRSIGNDGAGFFVARLDQQVVGLCHFGSPLIEECTDRKEIHRLFIHPQYVRQGIGGQFIATMRQYYRDDTRVNQFFAYVPETDTVRQAFYQKYGFGRDQRQDKDAEWYFVKSL